MRVRIPPRPVKCSHNCETVTGTIAEVFVGVRFKILLQESGKNQDRGGSETQQSGGGDSRVPSWKNTCSAEGMEDNLQLRMLIGIQQGGYPLDASAPNM